MKYFKIKTPAKINIGLNVIEKRNDGFHNIETLFYPLPCIQDEIIIKPFNKLEIKIQNYELAFEDNIIYKAVKILERETNCKIKLSITLIKNIPVGAGLGGGSSDAAAVIKGLNKFLNLKLPNNKLREIALELGSDVPFFLISSPALGFSRGEILQPVSFKINFPIVIINPNIHISTSSAFKKIKPQQPEIRIGKILKLSKEINFTILKENIRNDFEKIIFKEFPLIKGIKEELYKQGALFALMSGTGSTVYGIFETKEKAGKAIASFPANYFKFICF